MKWTYNIGIIAYAQLIKIASLLGNVKATKWIEGRKNFPKISAKNPIWIHCASLGEYEQVVPIIEFLARHSKKDIVLSFFSPSGYEYYASNQMEAVKSYFYLPLDTKSNANMLVDQLNPKCFITVKYEVWHNLLANLKYNHIPTFLISARVTKRHLTLDKLLGFNSFKSIKHLYSNDQKSHLLLTTIRQDVQFVGDTRIERVLSNVENFYQINFQFKSEKPIFIFGSVWKEDLNFLVKNLSYLKEHFNLIIAPHELGTKNIQWISQQLDQFNITYQLKSNLKSSYDALILDTIGELKYIYRYASFVYVGGAFKTGLHNIFEPLVYQVPIIFGNRFSKFPEAQDAIDEGIAFSVSPEYSLSELISKIDIQVVKKKAKLFINKRKGKQTIIIEDLIKVLS